MAGEPLDFRTHKVFTAERWADDWEEQPQLFCDSFLEACSTEFSQAEFHWDFGRVEGYDDADFQTRAPKDLEGHLVKIELGGVLPGDPEPRRWYGVFVSDFRAYGGESSNPGEPLVGQQELRALGLEFFLERVPLDSSICMSKIGSDPAEELEVERALPFNPAGGYRESRRLIGNMDPDGEEGPVFVENPKVDSFEWAGRDILDYLVGYHMPKDVDGVVQIPWTRADDGGILSAFQGTLDGTHGKSVRTVLSMLMDRRRLLGWRLVVQLESEVETGVEITPFNFNHADIDLPFGASISANTDTVEIDASDDGLVLECEVGRDDTPHFSRVLARGERVVVCGSIDKATLPGKYDKDWTDALKTEYQTASSTLGASYDVLNAWDKLNANADFRQQDRFRSVFARFLMKPETLNSPEAASNGFLPYDPKVNDKQLRAYPPLARFLSVLPLRDDIDYTTPSTSLHAAAGEIPSGSREEYMPPLAFIADGTRYYHLEHLTLGEKSALVAGLGGRTWSASVQMRHEALGFVVIVGGAEQHVLGKDDFTPVASPDPDYPKWHEELKPAALDWQDMYLTVALETDNWAEAQWPDEPEDTGDVARDLVLEFPGKRMEYVLEDTAFRLDTNGTLKKSTSAGWIVDDSEELKDLARVAYEWYQAPRRTLRFSKRTLDCPYHVGQIVTKLKRPGGDDLEEINSVITQIIFNLRQGSFTLRTQFAELDLRALTPPV